MSPPLVYTGKRHLSLIGLCFASIAAGIIGIDYFIQFQVLEPSLLRGETAGLGLFSQYNPHGFFIALEDLGLSDPLCCIRIRGLRVPSGSAPGSFIRWTLIVAALLGLASFIGMTWHFGFDIEYRFEVVVITITWFTLLFTGLMLAFFFRRLGAGKDGVSVGTIRQVPD